jgi:cellobiose-specific phosphotransferase system component IIC
MFKKNKLRNMQYMQGMVALFPAIIISSILILLVAGLSQSFLALLYRTTIFDQKTESTVAVEACVLRVMAKHQQDADYGGGESFLIGDDVCEVGVVASTGLVTVKVGEAVSTEILSKFI